MWEEPEREVRGEEGGFYRLVVTLYRLIAAYRATATESHRAIHCRNHNKLNSPGPYKKGPQDCRHGACGGTTKSGPLLCVANHHFLRSAGTDSKFSRCHNWILLKQNAGRRFAWPPNVTEDRCFFYGTIASKQTISGKQPFLLSPFGVIHVDIQRLHEHLHMKKIPI